MKTIKELEKEARECFLNKQKELPDVYTNNYWPSFYSGWIEQAYVDLLKEFKKVSI
jgi:hypothetical protein